jgi:hypothetical protein
MRACGLVCALALCACSPQGQPDLVVPQTPQAPSPEAAFDIAKDCDLGVEFGSYGAGIDQPALEKVEALVAADTKLISIKRRRWGREGEISFCLGTDAADAAALFDAIKAALPPAPKGPIHLATKAGQTFEVNAAPQ